MTKGQTSKLEARKKKKAAHSASGSSTGGLDPGGFPPLHGDEGGHAGAGGARHDRTQYVEATGGGRDGASAPGGGARPAAQSRVPRLLSASSSLLQRRGPTGFLPSRTGIRLRKRKAARRAAWRASKVIHVEEDNQKRSEPAAVPVLEAVPSATTPATDTPPAETVPSTETALIAAEPTGAGLGMPKEPLVVSGPSTVQYDAQRLPEDQVGAAKGAMVQAELMAGDAKRAYDSIVVPVPSLELRDDIRGVLAEREKSLEESREANKAFVAEMEKMGKQRTELMGQMKVMNRRCISQEKYVSDWARKMIALLGDFCMDAEAEAADVERSVIPNVPLGEDANRDMLRAHIRLGKVGPFIGRLREVVGRIDKELWPEDKSQQEMEGLMTRLEDVPNRVHAWKKSAARCGADVALSLVRVHCKEARKEKLKALQVANTKKLRLEDFMETFLESATRASRIDLDTFVEPAIQSASAALEKTFTSVC
ncbi:hypothetical protein ZWY2020_050869 [Hordeum vulgare]|nr:hypothetical protein ZWY2020_050869 [Hordeum vulgare]